MVVALGLGVLFLPLGPGDESPYVNDDVAIDAIFSNGALNGAFTATGAAICGDGSVTRLESSSAATGWLYKDEYRCTDGQGSFILQGGLPQDPDSEQRIASLDGTWTINGGTDDFGNFKGSGSSLVTLEGDRRVESYSGTLVNG